MKNTMRQILRKGSYHSESMMRLASAGIGAGASLALGSVFQSLLDDKNEPSMRHIAMISSALVASVMSLFVAAIAVYRKLESRVNHSISLHCDFYYQGEVGRTAYDLCTSLCMKAKRNITIVGPFFPVGGGYQKIGTESHDNYLQTGITNAVRRHAESHDADFTYTRIVQIDPKLLDEIRGKVQFDRGDISADDLGNVALAKHIDSVIKLSSSSNNVDVRVHAMSAMPSFPSTLIVDDTWLFFSLPSFIDPGSGGMFQYDVVLALEDRTGEVPRKFRQMISQLESHEGAFPIKKVTIQQS